MAYPMIALTTAGTTFACASVSLTETGLAVLNESGSRTGFVPYDSLEYVAPTEESRVSDPPMRILTEDGSTFGAASISQASAGIAVLDASGARIGFVPYDTLTYVLPEAKTGPTLPADATPVDGVNIDEEDDGGSPVWDDGEDDADGDECEDGKDDADGGEEDDADGGEDADGDEGSDGDADEGGSDGDADEGGSDGDADEGGSDGDECEDADGGEEGGSDGGEEDADSGGEEDDSEDGESADEDDEPVWGDDPVEESERGDGADDGSSDDASGDEESHTEDGEREEVEESELVVEWSFGDDE